MRGRYGFAAKFLCSVTPLLVGSIVVVFMIKPLFARQPKAMQPITLQPGDEPVFHSFVQRICELIGAQAPREVRIDCAVNASAGLRRGFLSFFGNDLVLTVGMPLVGGLSMRQLAGVIAHEFGHFTQGAGMRLSYVIRRVNGWFARVIYERDAWDVTLEEWSQTDTWWISLMVGCARLGVWFSRLLLTGLMYFGHAISSFLMRQMEYDADLCEVQVAGSEGFKSTANRLAELSVTTGALYKEMHRTWRSSHRLPDNMPMLISHHANRLTDEAKAGIAAGSLSENTGWLDTHPSNADRIAAAERAAQPGLFVSDGPAEELLHNYKSLSRLVTLAHYEDDLEIPATEDFLIPVAAVLDPPEVQPVPQPVIPQAPRWQGPPVS
jgi:hypothetical protein